MIRNSSFSAAKATQMQNTKREGSPLLGASLLALENTALYQEQSVMAIKAGADFIHFDVVGPHNGEATAILQPYSADSSLTQTPQTVHAVKMGAEKKGMVFPIDIHIMNMEPNETFIGAYIDAGADQVSLHWEAFANKKQLYERLAFIKKRRARSGISMRPDVNATDIIAFLKAYPDLVDVVSQCGVYPCLGGQHMDYKIINNVIAFDEARQQHKLAYKIMVDGGIETLGTARKCFWAGADLLVAGSAFLGNGRRDKETLVIASKLLKDTSPVEEFSIYDAIAKEIFQITKQKRQPIWVLIEGYHASGKTFIAEQLEKKLKRYKLEPVIIGLDISWTDRNEREQWKQEAHQTSRGQREHNYFDALSQSPAMHWRKAHSDQSIHALEISVKDVIAIGNSYTVYISNCYQFNEMGDTNGTVAFTIALNSVILVEGVFASSLEKKDWDLRIYIAANHESAKMRAMERDKHSVYRSSEDTLTLYEEVYEPTYERYLNTYHPIDQANIIVDTTDEDEQRIPKNPKIVHASHPLHLLECSNVKCGRQLPAMRTNCCFACGGDLKNVLFGDVDFLDFIDDRYTGMWRYHRLMPIDSDFILSDPVGNTPVVYLPRVSELLGIHLWLKLEITNPTGTFKDREAAYVIAISCQNKQDNVVMQSTGNTAIAITHYAGLANMSSWVFLPKTCTYKLLMPHRGENNHIIAVDGHPIDVKQLAEDFSLRYGFPKISPFYERCEANTTQAYEIAEMLLSGTLPAQELLGDKGFEFYVQTIAAGMGPIGYYLGMERLQKWTRGALTVPRILSVEITEFSPIQAAWDKGLENVGEEVATPLFPNHSLFEPTLWTTNIASYYPHLCQTLKSTNGLLAAVSPEQVSSAMSEYGIQEELREMGYQLSPTEKASFVGFAGLVAKIRSGEIKKGSRVILMLTGKGLHENFVQQWPDFTADPNKHKPKDVMNATSKKL